MTPTSLYSCTFQPGPDFAVHLDAADPLRPCRDLFLLPRRPDGTPAIYLCGHSLGLQPRGVRGLLDQELEDWNQLAVEGHFKGRTPWYTYHETLRDPMARLVGALPHEVVMMNSLTVNLHLMMATFYRPQASCHGILIDAPSFPSDLYAVQSQVRLHGFDPAQAVRVIQPRPGEPVIRTEDVEELLDRDGDLIELVLLSGVNFFTGQVFDIPRITAAAHRHGCAVGWDLAHAVGNVPLRLHDWEVDFAVWCSYKYLNGGPGAVGGCFVHEKWGRDTSLPRLAGWWGNDPATRFHMHLQPQFVPLPSADGWQLSNPPILALAPVRVSLGIFDEVGLAALRTKSECLSGYLLYLLDRLPSGRLQVITPREPEWRGCQVSLLVHDRPREVLRCLEAAGVVCDFREPNVIRVAPVPLYNTFAEVETFVRVLRQVETGSMNGRQGPQFTIVGAGLAGALLASYLGRAGQRVDLYEKRPDPRTAPRERGRSINLALSVRGIHALREIGLADEVLRSAILMRGRMIHAPRGELTFQPYGKDDSEALYSVSRAGLNLALIQAAARHETVRLFFGRKCTGIDLATAAVELLDEATRESSTVPAAVVIGADGVYSAVRAQMQKQERFDYRQDYLEHGYKELTIPAGPGGSFPLEKHALHIWPRGQFMMIALPNQDGSFTCTLFWPYEGPNSFAALKSEADVRAYFREQFADAVPLMPTLAEDFLHNPTGPLVTIRCRPWSVEARVVLIGDACHAVVPFLGQGMNAAFEDCTVLSECLKRHGPDRAAAFREYEASRKEDLDTLADLCVANFLEMRDRVASRTFVLRKKLGVFLHWLFPRWYLPLYTMIEFTRIPYAKAVRRARVQDWVVRGVVAIVVCGLAVLVLRW